MLKNFRRRCAGGRGSLRRGWLFRGGRFQSGLRPQSACTCNPSVAGCLQYGPSFVLSAHPRYGGDEGIRTLDAAFWPHAPLAGECLRPLGHVSVLLPWLGRSQVARRRVTRLLHYHAYVCSGALSSSNALCSTRTESSRYFSSITTAILISDVEI